MSALRPAVESAVRSAELAERGRGFLAKSWEEATRGMDKACLHQHVDVLREECLPGPTLNTLRPFPC